VLGIITVSFADSPKCPSLARTAYINKLIGSARELLHNGLAKSSRNAYATGQRRYVKFCKMAGAKPIPTSESILTLFITHLATSNISLQTIKVYLAAVRHIHVCKGLCKHFNQQITPRLHLILRGIQKQLSSKHLTKPRLPITLPILHSIKKALSKDTPSYDNTTFWAMCCLAFFGFLRVSEFTISGDSPYDPACHLSLNDIAVDSRANPRLLQLLLKQSKTDPFKQCTWVPLIVLYIQ